MKKRHIMRFLIIVLILTSLVTSVLAGQELEEKAQFMQYMTLLILQGHYSPLAIDDQFSERVFDLYLKYLDVNKRFFTVDDYGKLQAYKNKIDEELKNAEVDFFFFATDLLAKRIKDVKQILNQLMETPMDYTTHETLEIDAQKRKYPQDKAELTELWRKTFKYQVLQSYYDELRLQKKAANTDCDRLEKENKNTQVALNKAEKNVLRNLNRSLDRMLEETMEEKFHLYLDAVANSYDPHTEYLPPQEKEAFDSHISGTFHGIGASLQKEGPNIKVVDIIPGGPCWKQKELRAGDVILQVAQADEKPVDITNMSINEAVRLIRGKQGTTVRLTVQKPDGQITVISIIRDLVVVEESYAKSVIIEDKKSKHRFGYIYLPSFYHDFQRENGRSSAQDVKNALERLKAESVSGVVLDLRNNTGGLLLDTVDMAGHFIKTGPIVQVKERTGEVRVLQDNNKEVTYEGPLVILINSFSASASEILTAALQDYGRAIIVGSPRTFGKGTVQVVYLNLDDILTYIFPEKLYLKPLGFVKYTVEKYYRITGGSTQLRGVEPDIILPDPYSYLDYGEKSADYPLSWDEIKPLPFRKWNSRLDPGLLEKLKNYSAQRVEKNAGFDLVRQDIDRIIKEKKNSVKSLQLEVFLEKKKDLEKQEKAYESLKEITTDYYYILPKIDDGETETKPYSEQDETMKRNKEWVEGLAKDIYVSESINILRDLLATEY